MDRRTFLGACIGTLLWPVARAASPAGEPSRDALPRSLERALAESPFVYVSPLRPDGEESTCHGEVWYGWIDGAVVISTRANTWKARSLSKGEDRARIWVGDFGRWKRFGLLRNEGFRSAPSFEARASRSRDPKLLERLLALYEKKYPEEIGEWRGRFRKGFEDGTGWLVRYVPEGLPSADA